MNQQPHPTPSDAAPRAGASSRLVWAGLLLATALDVVVQLCWKRASSAIAPDIAMSQQLLAAMRLPLFHLTIFLWLVQFVNWMLVLARADLSYAQPLMSIGPALVALAAQVLLHEPVPAHRWVGIGIIVIGSILVAGTDIRTPIQRRT